MSVVVISQPMFFPWIGMHELMSLADDFVEYSDVAFSKGSFTNRVQIKTHNGSKWLTVPLRNVKLGQTIGQVAIDESQRWRQSHRALLQQSYDRAPFCREMLELVDEVYDYEFDSIACLALKSMQAVHRYYGLERPFRFHSSASLSVPGSGSSRVLNIVSHLQGSKYITAQGAKNYLEHETFEDAGISVHYMNYQKKTYPQLHGEFNPYVTTLDLVANCGRAGLEFICPITLPWREFIL